jgi:hypothetical protein
LAVVVSFLSGCDDELRSGRRSSRLDWKRAGLLAPGSDGFKRFGLSEPGDRHVFLAGFRIHRPDDDRFTQAGADAEEDSTGLSWGGAWRCRGHSQFASGLHVVQRVDSAVSVLQQFADQVAYEFSLTWIELNSMYIRHLKNASLLVANRMLAGGT